MRQVLLPILVRSWPPGWRLRCVELSFFDFACQLDSAQCYFRIPECLKSQHRITPLRRLPVLLLNHVIQEMWLATFLELCGQFRYVASCNDPQITTTFWLA